MLILWKDAAPSFSPQPQHNFFIPNFHQLWTFILCIQQAVDDWLPSWSTGLTEEAYLPLLSELSFPRSVSWAADVLSTGATCVHVPNSQTSYCHSYLQHSLEPSIVTMKSLGIPCSWTSSAWIIALTYPFKWLSWELPVITALAGP